MAESTYSGLAHEVQQMLGLEISPQIVSIFEWYGRELAEWNKRVNLTAIRDPEEIEIKHFLDSLSCLQVMQPAPGDRVVDVGTGAGFPGLPLKIIYPQIRLTLVESIGKKLKFCRHVVHTLGLKDVEILQVRAENLGQERTHRQRYDWAVARAVAVMPVLVEYLLPLLRVGGQAVIQKGESGPREAQDAEYAIKILGGQLNQIRKVELPRVVETRHLILIDKAAATPDRYPRRAGIPSKRPLEEGRVE